MFQSEVEQKFQTALDESRLLMLATQILFGFQFQTVFQDLFGSFTLTMRRVDAAAMLLVVVSIALLLAPASQHRFVERGQITGRIRSVVTRYIEFALLPFAISLGLDVYLVFTVGYGPTLGLIVGGAIFVLAIVAWYIAEFTYRYLVLGKAPRVEKVGYHDTGILIRVHQLLTEARIALPGAQALLGFQLAVIMTKAFGLLPESSRIVHAVSLVAIAVSLVLLVAPAAVHRIVFDGEDTESLYRIGSNLVTAALFPLAVGMSGDVYVAIDRILQNQNAAIATAAGAFILLISFWYVWPLILRSRLRSAEG
jgi:hypothetical protein